MLQHNFSDTILAWFSFWDFSLIIQIIQVSMYSWGVMESHHWVLVSVLHNCHWKGKGEHNASVTLSAKTYICSFPSRMPPETPNVRDRTEIEELLFLLSFGCMWLPNREHRDPEAVSFLQISAVFLAVTATADSLLGQHGERWVRSLYASGSFLMPKTSEDWMMQIG